MNLVLIGISGSGKGTQGAMIAQKYGLTHISTGELFRQEYEKKSPEGLNAYTYWGVGKWVPDDVTFALLKIYIDKADKGFVLDGFPRTLVQCEMLDKYLAIKKQQIDQAIYLQVSPQAALKRLVLRGTKDVAEKGQSREDEKEEIIMARFKSFLESSGPVIDYYHRRNILLLVDGEKIIDDIFQEIINNLDKIKA